MPQALCWHKEEEVHLSEGVKPMIPVVALATQRDSCKEVLVTRTPP